MPDGFEGNAQSFRIICRLSAHRTWYRGLNLTRATLNATLKYPHLRDLRNKRSQSYRKFGAYRTERSFLLFAREGFRSRAKSLEAAVMDVADDIAYSVHDFDDFYRAGLITIQHLRYDKTEFDAFLRRWIATRQVTRGKVSRYADALQELLRYSLFQVGPYNGTFQERASQRTMTSGLISGYVHAVSLDRRRGLIVEEDKAIEQSFLKRIVWEQVINNPALATLQHGQRHIVRYLFETYLQAAKVRDLDLLPAVYHDLLPKQSRQRRRRPSEAEVRVAADVVSSFTDAQALHLFRRLSGTHPGSITDLLDS